METRGSVSHSLKAGRERLDMAYLIRFFSFSPSLANLLLQFAHSLAGNSFIQFARADEMELFFCG